MLTTGYVPLARDPRYRINRAGDIIGLRGTVHVGHELPDGYQRVTIGGHHLLRHVLVAETFIGPRPIGRQVNHIDGNKANNHVDNLEYVTPSENTRHSVDVLGTTRAPGERNVNAKLTDDDVRTMRHMYATGATTTEIGEAFGVIGSHAWRIVTNRAWRHVA